MAGVDRQLHPPESCLSLGLILTAPYTTPGTEEVRARCAIW